MTVNPSASVPDAAPAQGWGNEDFSKESAPWSAEQVQQWRQNQPVLSLRRLFLWQALAGSGTALVAGWLTSSPVAAWSAAYGSLCVLWPAALFARGVLRRATVGAAVMNFFVWEAVKLGLTLVMLGLAPKLIAGLVWPALIAGLVVTMKASWVAVMFRRKV
ncbi:MAG: ATP synthase subunit I [Burkholderiaceae bacterium]